MMGWRMRPAASALGAIAIVCATITVTASESESGALERAIDHPASGSGDESEAEYERVANESATGDSPRNESAASDFSRNVTSLGAPETPPGWRRSPEDAGVATPGSRGSPASSATRRTGRDDATSLAGLDGLQRDQSDVRAAPASKSRDDRRREAATPGDLLVATTLATRVEGASSGVRATEGASSRERARENGVESTTELAEPAEPVEPVERTIFTEAWLEEQKDVEDIRAISFQVPRPEEEPEGVAGKRRNGVGKAADGAKLGETRRDRSGAVNNLPPGGKSTKAFYEIRPSSRTETDGRGEHPAPVTTQRIFTARKFVLPSVDSAFGKFGPYFEDGDEEVNVTARIGSAVLLDCKIGMLGDKKVTWLQHSKDSFRLLTVGRTPYSVDQRISLNFRYPSNWRLQILYASPRDSGLYKCQVATHPPLVKKINVIVTAPVLTITDDSGRTVAKERHLKAGSALRLRCEARDVLESQNESVVWTRGDETLADDVSENRTTEIAAGGREVVVVVSTLVVERASPRHAGNYSCTVPGKARTVIAVHVLNGELPAAVHDGNGVSRAVLNLWLIHLTVSYVFSR